MVTWWWHDVQSHPELPFGAQGIPKEPAGIPREPKGGQSDEKESPLGAQCVPKGNTMVTQWWHNGNTMVTQWLHNGYTMVTQWLHNGYMEESSIQNPCIGPIWHFYLEILQKGTKHQWKEEPGGGQFQWYFGFCRKWQTSFGSRLRSRIGVWASWFHWLDLYLCLLCFQCLFDVFGGDLLTWKSAARAASSPARA